MTTDHKYAVIESQKLAHETLAHARAVFEGVIRMYALKEVLPDAGIDAPLQECVRLCFVITGNDAHRSKPVRAAKR